MVSGNIQKNRNDEMKANSTQMIINMNPKKLVDDPDNHEIYSEYEVELLAKDMKENGFIGVILAYSIDGQYKIEAGHRRKYAAIKAELPEVPVMITEAPKNDIERRKRLVRANLHSRNYSTMTMAREAQYMYETYEQERVELEKQGLKPELGSTERVANDLEISISHVSRYRALTKLIPKIQKLLDEYDIPWMAFSDATSLKEEQQTALYDRISGALKTGGEAAITAAYIRKQIEECSLMKKNDYSFNRAVLVQYEQKPDVKEKKARRINGASTLKKSALAIRDSLDINKSYIKVAQQEEMLEEMRALASFINQKIKEIEEDGFSDGFNRKLGQ